MPKAIQAIWFISLVIFASPFMLSIAESSTQYFYAYGLLTDISIRNETGPTIDGVECVKAEQFAFHIHTKFNITIDNKSYPVPAQIGIIPNNCIYWLHTHDNSGTIHIESPIAKAFTLGQFLDIWSRFNNSDTVIQSIANYNIVNGTALAYINGTQMTNSSDYRNIELKDHDTISLMVTSLRQ
jgi:hypothetical protein